MSDITIVPLGAGQDVGRSCILLTLGGRHIMLDCGMHMGFNDDRRFPDFKYISEEGPLTRHLDCVIISHFHLDHCGALPYMSEMVGFEGPIYMTHPTKAICPILLDDYRKVAVERKGDTNFFTSEMVRACMRKCVGVSLGEVVQVDSKLKIKAYYAGHVLGAAMFHISVGSQSVVYTGDFNMTPDRHLGAARIDKCRPDVLISESTYATTIRDSKRCRERDFLKKVMDTIERGGKVLIPVFALGRAQELCILMETFWRQKDLKTPVYFSLGLTNKATNFYKLFITWTNESIKDTFVDHNMFLFKHITAFDKKLIDSPDPMVVFATPGMLHGGLSLQIFKAWCSDEKNTIIMPGYCVAGTIGWKILNGHKKLDFDNRQSVDVRMAVSYMSFSAHADSKGIVQLVGQCSPREIVFVHGEAAKMKALSTKIFQQLGIPCHTPANGEMVSISTPFDLVVDASINLLKNKHHQFYGSINYKKDRSLSGVLVVRGESMKMLTTSEAEEEVGEKEHKIHMNISIDLSPALVTELDSAVFSTPVNCLQPSLPRFKTLHILCNFFEMRFPGLRYTLQKDLTLRVSESVFISTIPNQHHINIAWDLQDDDLAEQIIDALTV